ncbi:hypothetical protein [Sphingomonas rubra]|uniref:Uncharacterized protein n=1 Tax=Sphingomonas rubra TaxID=634430 RepID=A0A1I5TAE3_9SPHN|nr:hypothetical protein [Sphingomonas rubra]SFP80014.1 hypothetical protein SAMN04488241_107179 [Sphingomonas rubra]
MTRTTIEAVRVAEADGSHIVYDWNPDLWFQIRDDQPFLDILTRGYPAQLAGDAKLPKLTDPCEDGTQWQRWDLAELLARKRRAGELTAELKNPRGVLRCYVVPTALLGYGDVVSMAEDVEAELGLPGAWDVLAQRPDRTWSRPRDALRPSMPSETIRLVGEEMLAAHSIRREPFVELAPRSRMHVPLPENALVSLWAARRATQLSDHRGEVAVALTAATARAARSNPGARQENIEGEARRLSATLARLSELKSLLAGFVLAEELSVQVHPGPLLQRDYRLRLLLRAFAASPSDAMTEFESARSHYPPVFLNNLWELWGAIWLVNEFRTLGFSGACSIEGGETIERCQWRLEKGTSTIELDFEAEPVLVDYSKLPPAHDRAISALEWVAHNQELDAGRPFVGTEEKCSPDYLIRITTPRGRSLLVGDACLASPGHHGRRSKNDTKPYTVERYRRTIGWAAGDQIVRCHPMGGFVLFPPPADHWLELATLPGASDCMLLCPRPGGDAEASRRLRSLLRMVAEDEG